MKTIILVRHGKSSWEHDVIDAERPLKARGKTDANHVADKYNKDNSNPERIFSSPAKRALETSKIFIKHLKLEENAISVIDSLYDFGGENVIKFIKNLPNEVNSAMLFGHNHAFTTITNTFGNKFIGNLPTSGLVKLNFEIDNWQDLKQGTTEFIIIPKELR